jgi:hypothetical protein
VGGILVVAPRPDVGIGQLGAHEGRHDQLEAASRWVMAGGQLLDFCSQLFGFARGRVRTAEKLVRPAVQNHKRVEDLSSEGVIPQNRLKLRLK